MFPDKVDVCGIQTTKAGCKVFKVTGGPVYEGMTNILGLFFSNERLELVGNSAKAEHID